MELQWYPGHMTKARREMTENVKKVDLVMEVLDARIPRSSRNPDIDEIAGQKYRLVLLNKSDLAEKPVTGAWIRDFEAKGIPAVSLDGRTKTALKYIEKTISGICSDLLEKRRKKGILKPQVRVLVAGIPNTGKSTIINSLAGRNSLKTGNKPGVTKASQWLQAGGLLSLLDTPGILWPKFEDEETGTHIAFIGSLSEGIADPVLLSRELLKELLVRHASLVNARYGTDLHAGMDGEESLRSISEARKILKSGGEADEERTAMLLLSEFRSGKLGRISLESPDHD
ncbi:MAG: ribosome biogenesis GTPase YlqF [Lachnospiraceae bacterium]|nr:ribosome biogenesis GTPase YlqF [Lachnospiraceae bacterium]